MKKSKIKAGDVFPTNEGFRVEVISYKDSRNVLVEFLDKNKHQSSVEAGHLRKGKLKNPFAPVVCGVGCFGVGSYRAESGGKKTPTYTAWRAMLRRCYDANCLEMRPTYIGCSVHPDWLNFQVFADWHGKEPNSENPSFDLDKDLRRGGRKVYSPETCSFVPKQINTLLTDSAANRGDLPQGVWADRKKFAVQVSIKGKRLYIGSYATPEIAFEVYRKAKADNVRSMAKEWKSYLHHEVYYYLMTWGGADKDAS